LFIAITNGSALVGAAGATESVALNVPVALVVTETSPVGSVGGGVAPITGTGPTTTVAPESGVVCVASVEAYCTPSIVAGP
jgi:hypothetical protein